MKTSPELREAAKLAAENAANELTNGGGITLVSLARIETNLRVASAAVNALRNRANGTEGKESRD